MDSPASKRSKQEKAEELLEQGLEDTFPASDPPAATVPAAEDIIPPGAGAPPKPREDKKLTDRDEGEPPKRKTPSWV
ncbi:hypothetical protein [Terrarubrum flagellatum]|uniref:hypothetical protein n=1 Tax=Terrirubrum flagellatum TaxID=2895980 RepID=UPI0031454B60